MQQQQQGAADAVDQELAEAEQALQQFRDLGQVLEARLKLLAAGQQQQPRPQDAGSTTPATEQQQQQRHQQQQQHEEVITHSHDEHQLHLCTSSSPPDTSTRSLGSPGAGASTTSSASGGLLAAQEDSSQFQQQQQHQPRQPPAWKQQVQHEKQLLQARQKQAAADAAARSKQQLSNQKATALQEAQQQLPFQVQQGQQVSSKVSHKLHKTLSWILRSAPTDAAKQAADSQPLVELQQCTDTRVAASAAATHLTTGGAAQHNSSSSSPTGNSRRQGPGTLQLASVATTSSGGSSSATHSPHSRDHASRRSGTGRQLLTAAGGDSKQQAWAAADAVTDAEVSTYLLDHWQQQHLSTAALVLQCAWRSRAARLPFGRYLRKRHASTLAALQPAFQRWRSWTMAAVHSRQHQQRVVLFAWQELVQLQLQLCARIMQGLRRGVLSGDVPGLMVWRLCTSSQQPLSAVRPSLGGMLASILLQRVPRMRQQECLRAWWQLCQSQAALRARALRMLSAVVRAVRQEQLRQALRFWRMYTACRICERLKLQLPALTQPCGAFDAWLWRHEHGQQLRQQAAGLAGRLGLIRSFVNWHRHVYKMRAMRAAWSGLLLHTPKELVRTGMNAFKATWREEQLHRRLLRAAVGSWLDLVERNKAVAAVRSRIKQVAQAQRKAAGLAAFQHFRRMSQLLSAAAVLKQWHARPLVLAHMHAWLGDTLHTTFYLCWWRWRRRAVARVRWRAALGLHMYRAHWVHLELVFCGWRKAAAAGKLLLTQQGSDCETAAAVVANQSDQQPHESPDSSLEAAAGSATAAAQAEASTVSGLLPDEPPAASCDGCVDGSSADASSCGDSSSSSQYAEPACLVHVSLADYPVGQAWRGLQQRRAVLAPQGLRRLTGLRLGRAARDLSELEGAFMVKDSDRDASGLLSSRVFARAGVSPGLRAMVNAQLPMNVLWRTSFPADAFWWQRVVGLLQHHVPHPDSWRSLIRPQHNHPQTSSRSNSHQGPGSDEAQEDLGIFLDPANSTCRYKCTCSRCHKHVPTEVAVTAQVAAKPAVDAAAAMARTRMRLRTGLALQPLQVPGGAEGTLASSAAPTPAAAAGAPAPTTPAAATAVRATGSSTVSWAGSSGGAWEQGAAAAEAAQPAASPTSPSAPQATRDRNSNFGSGVRSRCQDGKVGTTSSTARAVDAAAVDSWPAVWTCEDVAGLCRLVQAEELLETAVHALLGIGCDSSAELYDKLQQMTRGQARGSLQGDLLTWLLSAALAHDTAHSRVVMCHARARDELLVATMELRERAMALHLHIPHKFTLNSKRVCFDVRASWAAIIARVEQERDWDARSSEGSEVDPRERQWTALLPQQPQQQTQQLQWAPDHQQLQAASGATTAITAAAAQPHSSSTLQDQVPDHQLAASASMAGASSVAAQAAVMALANAAAGPRLRATATGANELAPGIMLAQAATAVPAGGLWTPEQASRSHTPGPDAGTQKQAELQQQLDAQQQAEREQQRLQQQKEQQKKQRQQKQAMAAAQGLFGSSKPQVAAQTNADPLHIARYGTRAAQLRGTQQQEQEEVEEQEIFTGPGFLALPGLSVAGSRHSSVSVGQPGSHRSAGSGQASSLSSGAATHRSGGGRADAAATHMSAASGGGQGTGGGSSTLPDHSPGMAADGRTAADHRVQPAVGVDPVDPQPAPLLRAELQEVLTDILAAGLWLELEVTAAAVGADNGADSVAGDGAVVAQISSSSRCDDRMRYGARSAAQCLAGAFADWAMQPAQQQQLLLQAEGSAASQLPPKPWSAPSTVHTQPQLRPSHSGCSTSSDASAYSSGHSSLHTRVLSASANLQPTQTAAARAACNAGCDNLQQHANIMLSSGQGGGVAAGGEGEESSWAALAVAHGLLAASEAGLVDRGRHSADQQQGPGSNPQKHAASCSDATADEAGEAAGEVGGSSSSQELSSSCSSLPSIPSIQGFSTQQHAAGGSKGGSVAKHGTAGQQSLPPIQAAGKAQPLQLHVVSSNGRPQQQQQQVSGWQSATAVAKCCKQTVQDDERDSRQQPEPQQELLSQLQDLDAQQMLPHVAAALQQQPGSTQLELESMQQALNLLEPAQLQQQLEMLLQAQRQQAAVPTQYQQQEQQEGELAPILPWGGEMLPPKTASSSSGAPAGAGGGVADAAAVVTQLLTASLSTRVAFWRQVAVQQCSQEPEDLMSPALAHPQHLQLQQHQPGFVWLTGGSVLSHQLHQLAWSSLLISSSRSPQDQQQQQREKQAAHQVKGVEGGASAALREKLHTYLSARMQWRQQQRLAPPLAPAEKWVTLEHEEQVLEFITSLTIAVHQQLLHKHTSLSTTGHKAAAAVPPPPFGSSSTGRDTVRPPQAAAAGGVEHNNSTAAATSGIAAAGRRVDMSQARRIQPTVPRQCPVPPVLQYVVPRPRVQQPSAQYSSSSPRSLVPHRSNNAARERLEPLEGWQLHTASGEEHGDALGGATLLSPTWCGQLQGGGDLPAAKAACGDDKSADDEHDSRRFEWIKSFQSSESSWAGWS